MQTVAADPTEVQKLGGEILRQLREEERERALTELRTEAVELSLAAASRLLESELDSEANRKLVSDYLGSLGSTR